MSVKQFCKLPGITPAQRGSSPGEKNPRCQGTGVLRKIARHIPLMHRLAAIRACREGIQELRTLFGEQKVVILKPFLGAEDAGARAVSRDVALDYLDVQGTVRMRRSTARAFTPGTVLLRHPIALLSIPATYDAYLSSVGQKTRNMIRRAGKEGFSFHDFVWNDYLDDIYAINTSKAVRSSGVMRGWYNEPVRPRFHPENELPFRKYAGAFKGNQLCGYLHLVVAGDNVFVRHIIGHANYLPFGIMNGLVSWAVQHFIGHPTVRWLTYGPLPRRASGSVFAFKRHCAFAGYATVLDLAGHSDLLAHASTVQSRWWAV
jgi:hypothetical protein